MVNMIFRMEYAMIGINVYIQAIAKSVLVNFKNINAVVHIIDVGPTKLITFFLFHNVLNSLFVIYYFLQYFFDFIRIEYSFKP